jgi:hypothetical protein
MKVEIKQYSQNNPIPQILHRENKEFEFVIYSTPWGDSQSTELAFDEIEQYLTAALQDAEVTSPFEKFEFYEKEVNELRIALLLANDKIYRSINQREYTSGCEISVILRKKNRLLFGTVGDHQVILRRHQQFEMVSCHSDPNDYGFPTQMMGIYKQCLPRCGALQIFEQDLLFLQSSAGLLLQEEAYNEDFQKYPSRESFKRGAWLSLIRWV